MLVAALGTDEVQYINFDTNSDQPRTQLVSPLGPGRSLMKERWLPVKHLRKRDGLQDGLLVTTMVSSEPVV